MNFTKHALILSALAISLIAVACSSDDEKGSTGLDSGLPADKQLGDLTADEITQLNNAGVTYTTQQSSSLTKEQACQSEAIAAGLGSIMTDTLAGATPTDESVQQACADEYTTCVASSDTYALTATTVTEAQLTDCTATVGEAETCYTEMTAAGINSYKTLPACNTLTVTGAATAMGSFTLPASCATMSSKCPNMGGTAP